MAPCAAICRLKGACGHASPSNDAYAATPSAGDTPATPPRKGRRRYVVLEGGVMQALGYEEQKWELVCEDLKKV